MEYSKKFKYIDLFAGIGAFHLAMDNLGGECVLASEIDKYAIETYKQNFGIDSNLDITTLNVNDIPDHDVLCAGFPCQAFSNAGHKKGFHDTRGTLFFEIERILREKRTKYIILENVKHLLKHDSGKTYKVIIEILDELGYILPKEPIVVSPHYIGIPQNRERIFILGVHQSVFIDNRLYLDINAPKKNKTISTSIYDILDENDNNNEKYKISEYENMILSAWDVFIRHINKGIYGFPIWVDEFNKDYDYSHFPKWKREYIEKNRHLYNDHSQFIEHWLKEYNVRDFKLRDRKFEWQAGKDYHSVWETSIQFRQSGIRCKKTDFFPALVAMVQTPVVGKFKRRLTPKEVSRLQSFPENFVINRNDQKAYRQFGNSANVRIIENLASQLLKNII
jgi:DNA (cytosine-5)-methyltransferase 1